MKDNNQPAATTAADVSAAITTTISNSTPATMAVVIPNASKDCTNPTDTPSNQQQSRKSNIHELRNQDYVSRLMAATPPYLYSAPVGPNNFFFSDMLRSLVQARNNETARVLQLQQQQQQQQRQQQQQQQQQQQHQQVLLSRRPRKRSWSHRSYYEQIRESKDTDEKKQQQQQHQQQQQVATDEAVAGAAATEKPLELTNKPAFFHMTANKYCKMEDTMVEKLNNKLATLPPKLPVTGNTATLAAAAPTAYEHKSNETNLAAATGGAADSVLHDTPPAASLPPQDLVLPPPPPVWYPPLYPPYGIDPLHFFIDLRVSGHIYDRKKENVSPLSSTAENSNGAATSEQQQQQTQNSNTNVLSHLGALSVPPHKQRHGSAFTVPIPKAAAAAAAAVAAATAGTLGVNDAINLSSADKLEHYAKYYDRGETKENQPISKSSANYMLQHLPRLYSQFAQQAYSTTTTRNRECDDAFKLDVDNKSEADCCEADADSDEHMSSENGLENLGNGNGNGENDGIESIDAVQAERDIDVEFVDSIKYRTDGESTRSSSVDESSITQID